MGQSTIMQNGEPLKIGAVNPVYSMHQSSHDRIGVSIAAVIQEMEAYTKRCKDKINDLKFAQKNIKSKQKLVVATAVKEYLDSKYGWGDRLEHQGQVYAFTTDDIDVIEDWDHEEGDTHRRDSWYAKPYLKDYNLGRICIWQDDWSVYWEDIDNGNFIHSDLPVGSRYPTRLQIVKALSGSGVKLDEPGFGLSFDYARSNFERGKASGASLVRSIEYSCVNMSLRSMSFHQNRCYSLLKKFNKTDYFQSSEYIENKNDAGEVVNLTATFNFKMVPKGGSNE